MKSLLRLRFASPVILVSTAWLGGSAFATPPGQFRLRLEPSMITASAPQADFAGLVDEQLDAGDPPAGKPETGWKIGSQHNGAFPFSATVDLGRDVPLATLWIYDTNSKGDVKIEVGGPDAWREVATYDCGKYQAWAGIPIEAESRQVLYLLRPGVAEALDRFVRAGGTLVTTYWSGYVDENDRAHAGGFPGPLRELAGVRSEELDGLDAGEVNRVLPEDGAAVDLGEGGATRFCDVLHVEGAEILARFSDHYYAGRPAVTRHAVGRGEVFYLGGLFDAAYLDRLHAQVMARAGVRGAVAGAPAGDVCVRTREADGGRWVFLLNFADESREVAIAGGEARVVSGDVARVAGAWRLSPQGAAVLWQAASI